MRWNSKFAFLLLFVTPRILAVDQWKPPENVVKVKVAVFCDMDCARMFPNETEEKLRQYLTSLFVGMDWRFKSVPNFKISFQVTSLSILKEKKEQLFIEQIRDDNGDFSIRDALNSFSGWVYEKRTTLPDFHVAMALVGAPSVQKDFEQRVRGGRAILGSVCAVNHQQQVMGGTFVLPLSSTNPSETAYKLMAQVFGAEGLGISEYCRHYKRNCSTSLESYLMTPYNLNTNSQYPPEFSDRDEEINEFLSSEKSQCLRVSAIEKEGAEIIVDTSTNEIPFLELSGVPVEQQCVLFLFDTKAKSSSNVSTTCKLDGCIKSWREVGFSRVYGSCEPIDGTLCADNGRCFKGRCIRRSAQLVSISTNRCLGIFAEFKNNTNNRLDLELGSCSKTVNWSNIVHFKDRGSLQDGPVTGDSSHIMGFPFPNKTDQDPDIWDLCLKFYDDNVNNEVADLTVAYCPIHYDNKPSFYWQLTLTRNGENVMLYHPLSKRCVEAVDEKSLKMADCKIHKPQILWRLISKRDSDILQEVVYSAKNANRKYKVKWQPTTVVLSPFGDGQNATEKIEEKGSDKGGATPWFFIVFMLNRYAYFRCFVMCVYSWKTNKCRNIPSTFF